MISSAEEISFNEFKSQIETNSLDTLFNQLGFNDLNPIDKHPYVGFFRSRYKNQDCLFLIHNKKEFVFF